MKFSFRVYIIAFFGFGNMLFAQNADDIISKHVQAIGGLAKVESEKTFHSKGTIAQGYGKGSVIEMFQINNTGFRVNYTLNDTTRSVVFYKKKQWNETKPGARSAAELLADSAWNAIDLDLAGEIIDYKRKGNTAVYLGSEMVNNFNCYKVKITRPGGKMTWYYIDTKTYYIIRSTSLVLKDGKEIEDGIAQFGDYRKTTYGTVKPYLLQQYYRGNLVNVIRINEIEINTPVDDAFAE